jgi:GGDEF domain-containing protein
VALEQQISTMGDKMRALITITALLLSFSTVNAEVGDQLICHAANFLNVRVDGKQNKQFIERNRGRKFSIAILSDSISVVETLAGQIVTKKYANTVGTESEVVGATINDVATETIVISKMPNPDHSDMYTATLTQQASYFANVWAFRCSKIN